MLASSTARVGSLQRLTQGNTPASRACSRALVARATPPRLAADGKLAGGLAAAVATLTAGAAHANDATAAGVEKAVQAAEAAVEQVEQVAGKAGPRVVEALTEAENALKTAEAAAATASESAVAAAVNEAATALKQASAAATSSGAELDLDLANALAAATAAIQEAAAAALEASGIDAAAVAATAAAGAGVATGLAAKIYMFLTTTEPLVLAEDALGAVAFAYLAPPLAKAGITAARGYSGDVLPTTALDSLASEGATVLVDIRAAADKAAAGVADLPDNDKLVELEYVRLDGGADQLRDPSAVCAESTAVRIAALKRLNNNRTVYLLDEAGAGVAKAVAKQLRKRGFKKVYTVQGGAAAWVAAKLSLRPWGASAAKRLLPAGAESTKAEARPAKAEAEPAKAAAEAQPAKAEAKLEAKADGKPAAVPNAKASLAEVAAAEVLVEVAEAELRAEAKEDEAKPEVKAEAEKVMVNA